ncbi:MAG: tryptophan synthase subunit alpha [Ignavibacteriales bacterium]|nr:tryptophan synthase subunit alpha [Ignavibacteriales bacterium]
MNRIQKKFASLKAAGQKALVPYITPEFPFKGMTLGLLRALEEAEADLIEVGIPFSDPLADGETIQHSSEIALKNGATAERILEAVREFRADSELPILLMGYINPIIRFGVEKFLARCKSAGVDGLIIPDLPPEEASEMTTLSRKCGISNVFLIAPTSSDARIKEIDGCSTDFSYCVSVTGVTGSRAQFGEGGGLDEFLQRVRRNSRKPFVVGFGISQREHVQRVWEYADGAVVGSSLINVLGKAASEEQALRAAVDFLRSIRPN